MFNWIRSKVLGPRSKALPASALSPKEQVLESRAHNIAALNSSSFGDNNTFQVVSENIMPMPDELKAPVIIGNKQVWLVKSILTEDDKKKMFSELEKLIPKNSEPSAANRIHSLAYIDCADIGSMPEGYGTAAAVTKSNGKNKTIFFNNSLDDYYNINGSPNIEKVITTLFHETLHAVSANGTGLQKYSGLMFPNLGDNTPSYHQPDEAITDYFSLQVYRTVFNNKKPYITGYWIPFSDNNRNFPVTWSGYMVGILKSILLIDEDQLKDLYFNKPDDFDNLINSKEEEIRKRWIRLLGERTWEKYKKSFSNDYKEEVLKDVIQVIKNKKEELRKVVAEEGVSVEKKRETLVKEELKKEKIPDIIKPFEINQEINNIINQVP